MEAGDDGIRRSDHEGGGVEMLTAEQGLDMLAEGIKLATQARDFDFVDYLCSAMLEIIDRKDEIHEK